MFPEFMNDIVTLVKSNGIESRDIKANIKSETITILDTSLGIEEGDRLLRRLPNGLTESYIVLDRGFRSKNEDLPERYKVKVKKESAIESEKVPHIQFNIQNANGSNIGTQGTAHIENTFNFGEVDQIIEEKGGEEKEELRDMIKEIKELFEDSEKIKKNSLSKFSELMEKHSWISGTVAQMGLGFLTGNLFK